MGLIVILIVVAIIWAAIKKAAVNTIDNAYANHQKKEEERRIDELNSDMDRLQEDWNRRVNQLGIDLNSAVRVKYYPNYHTNKNTKSYDYVYFWPVEGAIATMPTIHRFDDNGIQRKFVNSPLGWNIIYAELKDVRGVFMRNDVCLLQFNDISLGYAVDDYEKIKKVYEDAKAMTT